MHMALKEDGVLFRIDAAGDILRKLCQRAAAQIGRILPDGDRVQIGHEVEAVEFFGTVLPVADRP